MSLAALRDLEQGRTVRPRSLARLAAVLRLNLDQVEELLYEPPGAVGCGHGVPAGQLLGGEGGSDGPGCDRAGLRVRILGPLAVWRDGRPAALGPARQRAVFALLALYAGTGLSRAAIIDALWGDDPPATAAAMIQAQVGRIRRLLGAGLVPGGVVALSWTGSAYRLSPGSIRLDRAEFSGLAEDARRAAAAGQATAACELYERALSLWHGQPLEDIDVLRGHPAVAGLGRQRDAVVIEYATAAAAAGLQDQVISRLEGLAHREPLDERAHAHLMLSLAATGRQAAALRLYQQLSQRLNAELGVRPGPELSAAHLRVLREQVSSAAARTAAPAVAAGPGTARTRTERGLVVPRQLPRAVAGFVGRAAELAALSGMADRAAGAGGAVVISAIGGTAGVGKTALALHWAHQAADRFPDGQLHLNLRGFGPSAAPMTPAEAMRRLLDGLGVTPERMPAALDAQAGLYRSLLASKRTLIVVDNARDPAQVRPLLPSAPGCLVLVTSRNQLTGLAVSDGAHLLTLDVLTEAEADELLAQRLGQERVAAEPAAVAELSGLCARLPLALSVATAHAAARPQRTLTALAAELRGADSRLDALDTRDTVTDVRTVLSWSCQRLRAPTVQMFRLLGVHPGPDITVPAAASLAGQPSTGARQALDELASANMITEHAPGRYAFHDLLRAYAAEQARSTNSDDSRRAALVRIFDHYLHTANAASMLLTPYRDPIALDPPRPQSQPEEFTSRQQAMEWLQAERQVLLSVINCAADDGFGKHAWQLAWAVAMFFNWYGYLPELMATQQIALAAAARLGDQVGQAEAHRHLGVAQARLGCYAEANAHLTELLTLGQLAGDVVVQARAHLDLGHVCMLQGGKSRDALSHVEQSLRLYQVSRHRSGQGTALNAACWLSTEIGQGLQALEYGAQALAIHRELEDRINEAATLDTLGCAHKLLGNHAQAIVCYQQAVDVYGNLTDRRDLAEVLIHLGDAHQAVSQADAARRAWRRALAILDDMNHPDAEAARSRLKPGPPHDGNRPG